MQGKTNKEIFPINFIKANLVDHLGSMLPTESNSGYPYELFILISVGIEFLGACEDSDHWNKEKLSGKRFKKGMNLFPKKYNVHSDFLYRKLRCGMAHIYAPVLGLGLGENRHNTINLDEHGNLTSSNYQLDLNIQDFYADFKTACEFVMQKIEMKEYELDNKIYHPFLSVPLSS